MKQKFLSQSGRMGLFKIFIFQAVGCIMSINILKTVDVCTCVCVCVVCSIILLWSVRV